MLKKTLLLTFAVLALIPAVHADSLWKSDSGSLFTDNKAHKIGDILTVIVSEQTQATAQATTKTSKNESAQFGAGNIPLLKQLGVLATNGSNTLDASGTTTRGGSLTARITVSVKAIDANGNLALEGTRDVTINAEKQKMTFSGLVRPADVQSDNTVASASVADALVKYEGKGPIGNKQHDGIITRIFKIFF